MIRIKLTFDGDQRSMWVAFNDVNDNYYYYLYNYQLLSNHNKSRPVSVYL